MQVEEAMSSHSFFCAPEDTLHGAAQIMWEKDCGCLPVVSADGEIIGIITDRDICMAAYTRNVPLTGATVASVMSQPVVVCQMQNNIGLVEQIMSDRKLRRIPVLNERGLLAGMVTLADLARCAQIHSLRGTVGEPGIARTMAAICEPRPLATAAD